MESRVLRVAENTRSAELAEIDARRTVNIKRQRDRQVSCDTAEKEKVVGIAKEQAEQEIKVSARRPAKKRMDVRKVDEVRNAEIERDVAVVKAEAHGAEQVTVVFRGRPAPAQVVAAEAEGPK